MSAAERRAQLIEVGRQVFAKQGFEATTVEDIAAAAKVSKPIVYEHFGGKEGLYAVVVDREMEHVVRLISDALNEGTPREQAEKATVAFLTYVRDEPDGFGVLTHDTPSGGDGAQMSSLLSMVAERVNEEFVEGFEAAGFDERYAPVYAQALIGMVTFVGRWWTEHRSYSVEGVASHLSALAWMGLRHLPQDVDRIKIPKKKG